MAPHALTPTVERTNVFDEIWATSNDGNALNQEAPTNQQTASADSSDSLATSHHNEDRIQITSHSVTVDTIGPSAEATGNPATIGYEDAYIHGYKEGYTSGYTKSHIELKHQPIAIVGMSCRLPGNVSTPDEFWELLARSRTGFSSIPPSRFSEERFFHPNPGKSGTTNARGGNFLEHDLTAFDAPFFGFTQQEAVSLDPQQRLLLECTFEALESAGIPKHDVVGKDVGVFVGGTFSEYEADLFRDPETIPMHQATGMWICSSTDQVVLHRKMSAEDLQDALWLCKATDCRTSSTCGVRV